MSIILREFVGYSDFKHQPNVGADKDVDLTEANHNPAIMADNGSIYVDIEAIHEGPTGNFTRYMPSALKSVIPTWTAPYNKPLILHHNEKDGKIIGRVINAQLAKKDTLSGTPAVLATVNIPDKDAIEQVKDGRLLTTSIGVTGHDVRCSICGHQIAEYGPCQEHEKGEVYDGEICFWDVYDMTAKELSYVVVPSDKYAKNVKVYSGKKTGTDIKESLKNKAKGAVNVELTEAQVVELQESEKTLKGKVTQLQESLTASQNNVESKQTELNAANVALTESKTALATQTSKVTELTESLNTEKALRESAEGQAVSLQESHKKDLISTYNSIRSLANKPELTESELAERNVDSLKYSIHDTLLELKESLSGSANPAGGITKVDDPTITESNLQNVNKQSATSNVNLEEGLQELFSSIAGVHSYK